jgi:hypothetical protein
VSKVINETKLTESRRFNRIEFKQYKMYKRMYGKSPSIQGQALERKCINTFKTRPNSVLEVHT